MLGQSLIQNILDSHATCKLPRSKAPNTSKEEQSAARDWRQGVELPRLRVLPLRLLLLPLWANAEVHSHHVIVVRLCPGPEPAQL